MNELSTDRPVRFDGLVAVVTGAGRGLGRAYAHHRAARGARVVVNDIGVARDADRYTGMKGDAACFGADAQCVDVADRVAAEIIRDGGTAVASRSDVSRPDEAQSIVDAADAAFGGVDIVINNAGIVADGPIQDTLHSDLLDALAVHVGGAFNVARAVWPLLRNSGRGRMLNVASIEGVLLGNGRLPAYSAAKGGLWGLTMCLAMEGAAQGIAVNALLPGATTRGNVSVNPSAAKRVTQRSPSMTAPAALWLVHPDCDSNGGCYATDAGTVRAIFTSACRGYVSPAPTSMSIEEVRDNWQAAHDREGAASPVGLADYNRFRSQVAAGTRDEHEPIAE